MKTTIVRVVNDKLRTHAVENDQSMDQETQRKYVDTFSQDEHNVMKPTYVETSVVKSSITKVKKKKKGGTLATKQVHKNIIPMKTEHLTNGILYEI